MEDEWVLMLLGGDYLEPAANFEDADALELSIILRRHDLHRACALLEFGFV